MATRSLAAMLVATLLLGLVACGDSGDDAQRGATAAAGTGDPATHEIAPLATQPPPELDVERLQSDTPGGVVNAEAAVGTTFVGPLGEDFSIAVSLADGPNDGTPRDALVYVCDGHGGGYLTGQVSSEPTTLSSGGIAVDLARDGEVIGGTVTLGEAEPVPFTAQRTTGVAGLYGAEFSADEVDYRPVWVVLADGTQRGGACWRCCSGSHCDICCPAPADTAGPTVDPQRETWWQRWFRR